MTKYEPLAVPPLNKLKVGDMLMVGPLQGTLLKKDTKPQMLYVSFEGTPSNGAATVWVTYASVNALLRPIDETDQIHPMLAKTAKGDAQTQKLIADQNWWFEEKFDGERQILRYSKRLGGVLTDFAANTRVVGKHTGRLGESQANLPHLAGLPVPETGITVFDCELTHHKGFATLRSIMGSDPALAIQKQKDIGYVDAKIFDLLWFGGRDMRQLSHETRRIALQTWFAEISDCVTKQHEMPEYWLHTFLSRRAVTPVEKQGMLDSVLAAGGEGVMAKHKNGQYTDTRFGDQRSKNVLKIKPFTSDEFIIVGFEDGKGKYNQDKLGAVKLAQWVENALLPEDAKYVDGLVVNEIEDPQGRPFHLLDCGSCNIGTAEMEAGFRGAPLSFLGKVIEVKYQQRWPKTLALRHPSLLRFRPDKTGCQLGGETEGSVVNEIQMRSGWN